MANPGMFVKLMKVKKVFFRTTHSEEYLNIEQKASKAARTAALYNLEHFHQAWNTPNIRRLMGNELLFPPSPRVISALMETLNQINYYPEDAGTHLPLREALAQYVGLPGKADWVTVGNGSMENIDMVPRAFIDDDDEILLPCPDYSPYARRPQIYGAKVVDVTPDAHFNYTIEDFTAKLTPRTKMIILSRPNAPIGNMVSRDLVERLCQLDCIVVVDEAYTEFSQESVCDLVEKNENLLISRTFSKAMGLGGIRLGFLIAQPKLIEWINRVRVPINVSLLTQVAAIAAVEDEAYIRANTQKVIENRNYFFQAVSQVPGMQPIPSLGNFVMVNCKKTGKNGQFFYDALLKAGYLVRCFDNARGMPGEGFFRVTIGTRQDVEGVIDVLHTQMALVFST